MEQLDLVTIVVQHKDERKALDTLEKANAPGATYFYGRGTGVRQRLGLLGRLIESEKVVILTAVAPALTDGLLKALTEALELNKPGKGFVCVQKVERVVGYI
jgi:nitrogen regulatory protein P-II 1